MILKLIGGGAGPFREDSTPYLSYTWSLKYIQSIGPPLLSTPAWDVHSHLQGQTSLANAF